MFFKKFILLLLVNIFLIISIRAIPHPTNDDLSDEIFEFAEVDVDIYDYEADDPMILVEVIDIVDVSDSGENDEDFEDLQNSPLLEALTTTPPSLEAATTTATTTEVTEITTPSPPTNSMITGYPVAENADNPLSNVLTGLTFTIILLIILSGIGWCLCIRRRKRQIPKSIIDSDILESSTTTNTTTKSSLPTSLAKSAIMSEYHYVPSASYNDDDKKSVIDVQNYEYRDYDGKEDDGNINNSKSSVIDNVTSATIADNATTERTTTTTATIDVGGDNHFTTINPNASLRAVYGEGYNSSNNNTNSTLNDQTNETTVFGTTSASTSMVNLSSESQHSLLDN